jgi:hypothetical protein
MDLDRIKSAIDKVPENEFSTRLKQKTKEVITYLFKEMKTDTLDYVLEHLDVIPTLKPNGSDSTWTNQLSALKTFITKHYKEYPVTDTLKKQLQKYCKAHTPKREKKAPSVDHSESMTDHQEEVPKFEHSVPSCSESICSEETSDSTTTTDGEMRTHVEYLLEEVASLKQQNSALVQQQDLLFQLFRSMLKKNGDEVSVVLLDNLMKTKHHK